MDQLELEFQFIGQIYRATDELYHGLARHLCLSDSAFDILYAIADLGDGCLQRDICRMCYTSKQTINSSIRKLEQAELIRLQPGKGRDMHIFLTSAGHATVKEKICPVLELERRAFGQLSPEERQAYLDISRKYLTALQAGITAFCNGRG